MRRHGDAQAGPDWATLGAFIMMVVTTGGNVVAIKYVLLEPDINPLWAAASRFLLAALIFTIIARALRVRFPRGRALVGSVLYGGLTFGGFFGFVYWGLQEAPVGLAGSFSRRCLCSLSCWHWPRARSYSAGPAWSAQHSWSAGPG